MGTVIDELASLPVRIRASADRVADLRAELSSELRRRDELIAQGYDQAGMSYADIAGPARLTSPQVLRIVAKMSADDDD